MLDLASHSINLVRKGYENTTEWQLKPRLMSRKGTEKKMTIEWTAFHRTHISSPHYNPPPTPTQGTGNVMEEGLQRI